MQFLWRSDRGRVPILCSLQVVACALDLKEIAIDVRARFDARYARADGRADGYDPQKKRTDEPYRNYTDRKSKDSWGPITHYCT